MKKFQTGMSPVSVLFLICISAFAVVVTFKLVPHYIDYYTLKKVYQDVNERESLDNMSPQQILSAIDKRLTVNAVDHFKPKDSSILSKETGKMQVGFDYEITEHLFGNVSVIIAFEYMPE